MASEIHLSKAAAFSLLVCQGFGGDFQKGAMVQAHSPLNLCSLRPSCFLTAIPFLTCMTPRGTGGRGLPWLASLNPHLEGFVVGSPLPLFPPSPPPPSHCSSFLSAG